MPPVMKASLQKSKALPKSACFNGVKTTVVKHYRGGSTYFLSEGYYLRVQDMMINDRAIVLVFWVDTGFHHEVWFFNFEGICINPNASNQFLVAKDVRWLNALADIPFGCNGRVCFGDEHPVKPFK